MGMPRANMYVYTGTGADPWTPWTGAGGGGGGGGGGGLTDAELRASPLLTEPLGTPTVAKQVSTSGTSASVALAAGTTRVSCYATEDLFFGVNAPATAFGHWMAKGERLDFRVPAGATLHAIQSTAAGILRITELG